MFIQLQHQIFIRNYDLVKYRHTTTTVNLINRSICQVIWGYDGSISVNYWELLDQVFYRTYACSINSVKAFIEPDTLQPKLSHCGSFKANASVPYYMVLKSVHWTNQI